MITGTLEGMAGVINCDVNLEEKSANVEFDPYVLDANIVVETINNIEEKVSIENNWLLKLKVMTVYSIIVQWWNVNKQTWVAWSTFTRDKISIVQLVKDPNNNKVNIYIFGFHRPCSYFYFCTHRPDRREDTSEGNYH